MDRIGRLPVLVIAGLVLAAAMLIPAAHAAATGDRQIAAAFAAAGGTVAEGATYLAMEGPQFSTKAESELYRAWGCDVIGMTNMPEAKLAREAEITYATIAMVTDYDCWHPGHEAVTVADVVAVVRANTNTDTGKVTDT